MKKVNELGSGKVKGYNANDSYYSRELNTLCNDSIDGYVSSIRLLDYKGNSTKVMSLNIECIDEVIYYLQCLRDSLVKSEG